MTDQKVHIDFPGRIVFIGFGSIGQGVLPLVLRHIGIAPERIAIVTAEDRGIEEAKRYGIKFIQEALTRLGRIESRIAASEGGIAAVRSDVERLRAEAERGRSAAEGASTRVLSALSALSDANADANAERASQTEAHAAAGRDHVTATAGQLSERMGLAIVNEAARCVEEGIVSEAGHVDLAMIFGTGFSPFLGGPLRWADSLGLPHVVGRLRALQAEQGGRFEPCALLVRKAEAGETFTQPVV